MAFPVFRLLLKQKKWEAVLVVGANSQVSFT
jgi:hypothetical protein